jgi:hypothetical protein
MLPKSSFCITLSDIAMRLSQADCSVGPILRDGAAKKRAVGRYSPARRRTGRLVSQAGL